jgi:hypothetical protein
MQFDIFATAKDEGLLLEQERYLTLLDGQGLGVAFRGPRQIVVYTISLVVAPHTPAFS